MGEGQRERISDFTVSVEPDVGLNPMALKS